MLLEACNDLRPAIIDSVPVMVEGLFRLLEAGQASAEQLSALQGVHAIMAGGCQLNEELLVPLAKKHGINLVSRDRSTSRPLHLPTAPPPDRSTSPSS